MCYRTARQLETGLFLLALVAAGRMMLTRVHQHPWVAVTTVPASLHEVSPREYRSRNMPGQKDARIFWLAFTSQTR